MQASKFLKENTATSDYFDLTILTKQESYEPQGLSRLIPKELIENLMADHQAQKGKSKPLAKSKLMMANTLKKQRDQEEKAILDKLLKQEKKSKVKPVQEVVQDVTAHLPVNGTRRGAQNVGRRAGNLQRSFQDNSSCRQQQLTMLNHECQGLGSTQVSHVHANQTSAHAGGKKYSINSNMNLQQSQQVNSRFNNTQVISTAVRNQGANPKDQKPNARPQRLYHRESLKSLEAQVLKVPMQTMSTNALHLHSQTFSLNRVKSSVAQTKGRKQSHLPKAEATQKAAQHQPQKSHNNGLDFLEVKKEIKKELKEVERRILGPKKTALKTHNRTMIGFNDQSVQDLRYDPSLQALPNKDSKLRAEAVKSYSPIEGRGEDHSKCMHSHSALPGMTQVGKRLRNNFKKAVQTSHGVGTQSHLNLQHMFLNESNSVQQLGTSQLEDQSTLSTHPPKPTKQKSQNKQPSARMRIQKSQLDLQLSKMLRDLKKERQRDRSDESASLRDRSVPGVIHSVMGYPRENSPLQPTLTTQANLRQSQKTMKSISSIVEQTKSRPLGPYLPQATSPLTTCNFQFQPSSNNLKLKTIDSVPFNEIEFSRKIRLGTKSTNKLRQPQSYRNKKAVRKAYSMNPVRNCKNPKQSSKNRVSKSNKSRPANNSKKSRDGKKSRSRGRSNSQSMKPKKSRSSKSKNQSNSRINQEIDYSKILKSIQKMVKKASRLSAQLNKKIKKQGTSQSPKVEQSQQKVLLNIVTRNQRGDANQTDYDYNKYMNGTIKGLSTKLQAGTRKRNRSQAKLQTAGLPQPPKYKPTIRQAQSPDCINLLPGAMEHQPQSRSAKQIIANSSCINITAPLPIRNQLSPPTVNQTLVLKNQHQVVKQEKPKQKAVKAKPVQELINLLEQNKMKPVKQSTNAVRNQDHSSKSKYSEEKWVDVDQHMNKEFSQFGQKAAQPQVRLNLNVFNDDRPVIPVLTKSEHRKKHDIASGFQSINNRSSYATPSEFKDKLQEFEVPSDARHHFVAEASSRSNRSVRSGILAQLGELASAGRLRPDNEAYLEKLLESQIKQQIQEAPSPPNEDMYTDTHEDDDLEAVQISRPISSSHQFSPVQRQSLQISSNVQQKTQSIDSASDPKSLVSIVKSHKGSGQFSQDNDGAPSGEEPSSSSSKKGADQAHSQENLGDQLQTITIVKTDTEADNGPTTLISHLNDPHTDVITYNEEEEGRERGFSNNQSSLKQSETINQRVSPLENTLNPTTENLSGREQSRSSSGLVQQADDPNAATAENLIKYLETKWNEKKQEGTAERLKTSQQAPRSGSQTDLKSAEKAQPANLEDDSDNEFYHSSSSMHQIDHEQIILAIGEKHYSEKSRSREPSGINASEPSPPKMQENQFLRDLAQNPQLDGNHLFASKEEHDQLLQKSPGSESPVESEKRSSNELDKYLDDDISEKGLEQPAADDGQVQQMNQVAEMVITSNLTTLNLDGDNSSDGNLENPLLDSAVPGPELEEDDIQSLKDKKYLEQFRKRQNRNMSKPVGQFLELNQIEIEIQENSDPVSPRSPPIHVALSTHPSRKPTGSQAIESVKICAGILESIISSVLSQNEYHENLIQSSKPEEKSLTRKAVYDYIANSVNQNELKHQIKQIIDMKQRTNLENELLSTDDYVFELLQYLLQFELITHHQLTGKADDPEVVAALDELGGINYLVIFLKNLTTPIKRDLVEQLRIYANQRPGAYEHFESVIDPLKYPILPIDAYLDVEKHREYEFQLAQRHDKAKAQQLSASVKNYLSGHSASSVNTVSIIQESQHILNKSIFDAMNESLTKFRPYGVVGEPLPWSIKFRRLQTDVDINSVDTERLIQMVKQEVFRWMSIQQGALSHSHEQVFQYIDLHIPLMPQLKQQVSNFQQLRASVEEETVARSEVQVKPADLETNKLMLPEEKQPKNKIEPKDQLPIKVSDFESAEKLANVQQEQFTKFKKALVEEVTSDIRQGKLAAQLQLEILEDEHWWLNYEFEETQIRMDLSEHVFELLVSETIDFLNSRSPNN